ncbi:hypothetical protein [Romboutsia lituseburensis]|uniref:Uncharacterized protein n=1 Tax=Romboutsia lituseburensis DSM 797 TaxID=1121325 RepID=A0A1G9K6N2_9FIRM|nr:hypothetical protein [Romboutsia lituseburensis]CEH34788.1 Hypothetical protein RLITU_2206 [Romboutsia lituseburensis]SDL45408.1 hypothetical protein SAMN04515677_10228 [Romboutsia lituseburensis DSM 797]
MNSGQEKFLNFIIERVELENQNKAKELLNESFAKQEDGTFNKEYMMSFIPRMLELIKPEFIEEVKNIMISHKA